MTPAVEQLVRETMELTGAETPQLMEDDAPVLSEEALGATDDGDAGDFYLVGIIGGKDVGKSALVNALVGRSITAITSHGPGTETVVAYAHATREPALRALLEREVPGQFRIVTHESAHLLRQVLLDLPDIDSHFRSHLEVTRAMLRHMLYPVWVQSVEKYADRQPQEMLARVAAGNAAQNFVFCLNKVDQVEGSGGRVQGSAGGGRHPLSPVLGGEGGLPRAQSSGGEGRLRSEISDSKSRIEEAPHPNPLPGVPGRGDKMPAAAVEIREDFAARIAKTLGLGKPPDVFLISAIRPERYELPRLRALLSKQKSD